MKEASLQSPQESPKHDQKLPPGIFTWSPVERLLKYGSVDSPEPCNSRQPKVLPPLSIGDSNKEQAMRDASSAVTPRRRSGPYGQLPPKVFTWSPVERLMKYGSLDSPPQHSQPVTSPSLPIGDSNKEQLGAVTPPRRSGAYPMTPPEKPSRRPRS